MIGSVYFEYEAGLWNLFLSCVDTERIEIIAVCTHFSSFIHCKLFHRVLLAGNLVSFRRNMLIVWYSPVFLFFIGFVIF